MTDQPLRVLFLCTGNSCRSQMAEGLTRHLSGGQVQSFSAGTDPKPVHPLAIRAMADAGIDISHQSSKHLNTFLKERFDYVITVCDRAKEGCPIWPGVKAQIHWSIDDPAAAEGTEDARMRAFVTARNTIAQRIRLFLNVVGVRVQAKTTR